MSAPIYSLPLRALDHRLLWWMLAHQGREAGIPNGVVTGGWRAQALKDLKTHRPLLWKAEQRLRDAGVLVSEPYARETRINGDVFG